MALPNSAIGDALATKANQIDKAGVIQYGTSKRICAFDGDRWVRSSGALIRDDCLEAEENMLEKNPGLKKMYSATDDNTEMFYFENAVATFYSFTSEPETITF